MDFYARLGARLRALRIQAGLSQAALGARLGRTPSAIDRYEMGQRRLALEDVLRLARILGVPAEALFEGPVPRAARARVRRGTGDLIDRLRTEHTRLLAELDARLTYPARSEVPAGQVGESGPRYRIGRRAGKARETRETPEAAPAAAPSPAKLRALARRAGWTGAPDAAVLERYAAMIAAEIVGRGRRAAAPRKRAGSPRRTVE